MKVVPDNFPVEIIINEASEEKLIVSISDVSELDFKVIESGGTLRIILSRKI